MSLLGRLSVVGARRTLPAPPPAGLLDRARRERTLPVVCRNLGIPCSEESSILARQLWAVRQAREILSEVEALPLKGLHLAHRLYPSPGLRDMGDIDLLVRRETVVEADRTLRRLGYVPERDPRPSLEVPDAWVNSVLYARGRDLPVHLHWDVRNGSLPGFMVRIDPEEIWRERDGGGMAPHHLLVTLCEHALKHSYDALVHLTDIELAARAVRWERVEEVARRWGLERAVYFALVLVRDLLGVETPGLKRFRPAGDGPAAQAFLASARRRRWVGLSALGYLLLAEGPAGKIRFLREMFRPPRGGPGLRSRTAGSRLRRAVELAWRGLTSPPG
ncbi:MAG TPA: nucleotidyltransferase family protein [Planctomycetota bacterium]|nr:nucleotidyltransferase family protein [Planctomycetota bacterium]